MIVQSATIGMASSYSLSVTRSRTESMRAWIGDQAAAVPRHSGSVDQASISQTARELARQAAAKSLAQAESLVDSATGRDTVEGRKAVAPNGEEIQLSPEDELKVRLIEDLLSRLFGRDVKLSRFKGYRLGEASSPGAEAKKADANNPANGSERAGWGLEIAVHEKETREERSDFQAAGEIRTADGKVLNLSMRLTMASSTTRESSFLFQAGDAVRKDPLVLNFGGTAADLTDATFAFDLEGDGSMENVAFATGQSAFLARLPAGGAGGAKVPVDGSALFGTRSGDGFGDLAALDADGNGWVDEGDPAWKELALWSRDESGNDTVASLGSRGVGALYVGSVRTPFEMGAGAVAETGLWLSEGLDGGGTIQHLDLSV